jgi:hypothetical protein
MVDGLENLDIQELGFRRIKWHAESHKGIGQALYTNANGAMAHV